MTMISKITKSCKCKAFQVLTHSVDGTKSSHQLVKSFCFFLPLCRNRINWIQSNSTSLYACSFDFNTSSSKQSCYRKRRLIVIVLYMSSRMCTNDMHKYTWFLLHSSATWLQDDGTLCQKRTRSISTYLYFYILFITFVYSFALSK